MPSLNNLADGLAFVFSREYLIMENIIEHYKNLDLQDIVYFCEVDLIEKTEKWKDVPDYEGMYRISDLGRIKSLNYKRTNQYKILKPYLNNVGYRKISLCKNGIVKKVFIHQLVFYCFSGETKSKCFIIDHKNNIRIDNRFKNLQSLTQRKNTCKDKVNFNHCVQINKQNKFSLRIKHDRKSNYFGVFKTEEEAKKLYHEIVFKIENYIDYSDLIIKHKPINEKGTYYDKENKKWRSFCKFDSKTKQIGRFNSLEEAKLALNNFKTLNNLK